MTDCPGTVLISRSSAAPVQGLKGTSEANTIRTEERKKEHWRGFSVFGIGALGAGCREFKSLHPDQSALSGRAPVAHLDRASAF